jgi:hypothetical protein
MAESAAESVTCAIDPIVTTSQSRIIELSATTSEVFPVTARTRIPRSYRLKMFW